MWPFKQPKAPESVAPIFFTNTLTGKKDLFCPITAGVVTMYSCGPTVYSQAQIGNLRSALLGDLTARVLLQSGYHVRRVINITDVGHLVGDADDEGEDKMSVGAMRAKKSPSEIAEEFARMYISDLHALNVDTDRILFPRATEYIKEQIVMVKALQEKGFAYTTASGVYFDTSKLPNYGKLGGVAEVKLMRGARVKSEDGKKSLHDFALWRKAKPKDLQKWPSPWGSGNPGWHIECSAMIRSLLGSSIDIHTGGMDLIPVHHNNELAQTEGACGTLLARTWIHGAFVNIENEKISKSLGNAVVLPDITSRGYSPLALRYFYLQSHYRTPTNFTWDALAASNVALHKLWVFAAEVLEESKGKTTPSKRERAMVALLRDDLATPAALALLWEVVKDDEATPTEKMAILTTAEAVMGISLLTPPQAVPFTIPEDIQALAKERDAARENKDFARSDELRIHIQDRGYRVDDGPSGTRVSKF